VRNLSPTPAIQICQSSASPPSLSQPVTPMSPPENKFSLRQGKRQLQSSLSGVQAEIVGDGEADIDAA
jgi:hypothetical protein